MLSGYGTESSELMELEELRKKRMKLKRDQRKKYRDYEKMEYKLKVEEREAKLKLKNDRNFLKRDKKKREELGFTNQTDWINHIEKVLTIDRENKLEADLHSNQVLLGTYIEEMDIIRDKVWDTECKLKNLQLYYGSG